MENQPPRKTTHIYHCAISLVSSPMGGKNHPGISKLQSRADFQRNVTRFERAGQVAPKQAVATSGEHPAQSLRAQHALLTTTFLVR